MLNTEIIPVQKQLRESQIQVTSFDIVDKEKSLKEISNLDHTKACQESNIPTKMIKENADIFSEVLHLLFNASVNEGSFLSVFKLADVPQF